MSDTTVADFVDERLQGWGAGRIFSDSGEAARTRRTCAGSGMRRAAARASARALPDGEGS